MANIINWFAEPLSHAFMQHALFIALMLSLVCAILSCYVILKSWSLMGDAISHSILPGIVLAYIANLPLALGALSSGLLCAFGIGFLKENSRIKEDTLMGIVFSGMFALGLVLFSKVGTEQHLSHILFGNLLGIKKQELIQTFLITIFVLFTLLLKKRDFLLYCFDPSYLRVVGLSPKKLHYSLLFLLAISIVTTIQAVGVILVTAMLISPGITAYTLTKKFNHMLIISVIISITTSFFGIVMSYHIDSSPAPTIILLQALCFIFTLIYSKLAQKGNP